jgi:hypothetical protein
MKPTKPLSFSYNRAPPWFFQFIENYSHFFLDIKFDKKSKVKERIGFSLKLELLGYEGLIFYIYRLNDTRIIFDIVNQKVDSVHTIEGLEVEVDGQDPSESIDFIIIPFGHFKEENKMYITLQGKKYDCNFQIFSWIPSLLFKNVKSIIRIDNKYNELIPLDDIHGYFYHFDYSFKGNKTEMLFSLINTLSDFDTHTGYESIVAEIKMLISKTNEYLFELTEKKIPVDMKNLIKELERVKFNIDNLSKEEIFNWLDNIIDYYKVS